ncbi:glycosyltransferase family 87 protein [Limnoglobus roseus]|uniref:DUF2029 domain-containing protein n=1 Tax=Limnoglobus roseus TaxID=2598579 RepID=A0A5C1A6B4_9BACT|nr:glycosyltransferase family 87 protein [Limnoglobus roseus]QEL13757.1 hypothetical protein PX52LOC_00615 [Limnoglobus roseus]
MPTRYHRMAGLFLALAVLGWVSFRMTRRLAEEPYVDFRAFYDAATAVNTNADIYRAGAEMYIYPPMLAAWMSPLARLPILTAGWVWYALAVITTVVALRGWWRLVEKRFALPPGGFAPALGAAVACWIEQVRREAETGQCDWLLLGALVLAAVTLDRRPIVAGVLLGFAVNVKYVPIVFVVWLLIRRRWTAAIAAIGATVLWAVLPALVLGWDRNLDYLLRATAGLGKLLGIHVEGQPGLVYPLEYEYSVSVPSGAARVGKLLGVGRVLVVPIVGLVAAGCLLIARRLYRRHGFGLFVRRPTDPPGLDVLEWTGLLVAMLAFSPQTQNRHLFLLLPMVLLATGFLTHRVEMTRSLVALVIGVLGTALIGDAVAIKEQGAVNWGFFGGGGLAILAMFLILLDAGLRQLARSRGVNTAGLSPTITLPLSE